MDCAEEVSMLRSRLSRVQGVYDLKFDVIQAKMSAEFAPSQVSERELIDAVAGCGLSAQLWEEETASAERRRPYLARHGLSSASLALLLSGVLADHLLTGRGLASLLAHEAHAHQMPLVPALLYGGAILFGFVPFLKKAWASLRSMRPDMNLLVGISIAGACVLGEWLEGASLAFLYSLAAALESWSTSRARLAVTGLLSHCPREAAVIHGDHEHRIPSEKVVAGQRLAVRPGERIPCDGVVRAGSSYVDQSLITGESVPVPKTEGGHVYAGTLNTSGFLEIEATRPAADTTLARILRMVTDSAQRRTQAEVFIERFVRWYTPAVFAAAFALIVFPPLLLGWTWAASFYQGMVILLISCPCALVISTPVTVVSALASAARMGVLIKGGSFLELAAGIRSIAFDKTGVLTMGRPSVVDFIALNGAGESAILARLAGLEARSEHPLGRAIVEYAKQRGVEPLPPDGFVAIPGRGVLSSGNPAALWSGGMNLIESRGIRVEAHAELIRRLEREGATVVFCGEGQEPLAAVALSDQIRPEAALAIQQLRGLGIGELLVLTGDHEPAARAATKHLAVDQLHAGLLPDGKAEAVRRLDKENGPAAMIGDGYNDGPAMAAASLAVAFGPHSTDLAVESADVVLMAADLTRLPFLVRHSRRASAAIRQNVAIALGLKLAFLAFAAAGAATLWMAIAADMGATLLVTLNGLRLLRPTQG